MDLSAENNSLEMVRLLIEKGADLTVLSDANQTPLSLALELGNPDMLSLLIEHDVDLKYNINTKGDQDRTLLHYASALGNAKIIRWLINNKADINAIDSASNTPLDSLILVGSRTNWDEKSSSDRDAYIESLEVLITNGACLNDLNRYNSDTFLQMYNNIFLMVVKQPQENTVILDFLIKNKVNVNVRDKWSHTPLHLASALGNEQRVRWLI